MVMTVEPGLRRPVVHEGRRAGEAPRRPRAACATRRSAARSTSTAGSTARRPSSSAASGVDVLVVGSALWIKGHDMGREIRLIRALADEGYQSRLNDGVPPIPRDQMVTLHVAARSTSPKRFMDEIEAGGIPVVMLRGDGQINPDGVRDYDLLVPATVEALVVERHADARDALPARGRGLARGRSSREHGVDPAAQPPVRALLQRTTGRARRASTARSSGAIGPGLVILLGVGPDDDGGDRRRPGPQGAPSCASSATTTAGRTARSSTSAARRSSSRSSRSTPTRAAAAGPGSPARRSPELAERLYQRFADALRGTRRDRGDRPVRGRDGGRARQRRPVHDLARHGGSVGPPVDRGGAQDPRRTARPLVFRDRSTSGSGTPGGLQRRGLRDRHHAARARDPRARPAKCSTTRTS